MGKYVHKASCVLTLVLAQVLCADLVLRQEVQKV